MIIKILGSGQDAGIPHIGCYCVVCKKARRYARFRRLGPSIAILDKKERYCYLIDASPDFEYQINMARKEVNNVRRKGKIPISGILLTHTHFGHISGLLHLGKEAVDEKGLPVYCTSKVKRFIKSNYPFGVLARRKNIKVRDIRKNEEFKLDGFKCMPIQVPHRNEVADTVGFIIKSKKRIIYLPDIDYWTDRVVKEIRMADIAIIDGTFYVKNEIPRFREVPHPPIRVTIRRLKNANTKIYFTHINHTNVINRYGKEKKLIEDKGFKIAYDGMILKI